MGKGAAEGCASCAKWLLIIFNVIFCLLGLGFIAAGAYAYAALSEYLDFIGNKQVNAPAIILIVFGCVTLIIAAIGFIGACKESPCMLFTFAVIIGILFVVEVAAGITAFVYRGKVEEWILANAPELMMTYGKNESNSNAVWDIVQEQLKCCGVESSADWLDKSKAPFANGIPASCNSEDGTPFTDGCVQRVKDLVEGNIIIVAGVGVAFAVIELLGIIFACCVGCQARKGEYA